MQILKRELFYTFFIGSSEKSLGAQLECSNYNRTISNELWYCIKYKHGYFTTFYFIAREYLCSRDALKNATFDRIFERFRSFSVKQRSVVAMQRNFWNSL